MTVLELDQVPVAQRCDKFMLLVTALGSNLANTLCAGQ
jgi:hypothetical protein